MKRLTAAAVATAAAAALALAGGAAATTSAAGACLHASVTVNGTNQTVDQCVPPAS